MEDRDVKGKAGGARAWHRVALVSLLMPGLGVWQPALALTQKEAIREAAAHYAPRERVLPRDLHAITRGHGPYTLYIFWDPNCLYCHLLYEKLVRHAQRQLTIHWVPVGIIKASSLGKAAAVIAGGWSALQKDERGFHLHTESGAIAPSRDRRALGEARANTKALAELMVRHGQRAIATPTLWDPQTHWLRLGMPPSIAILLRSLQKSRSTGKGGREKGGA
ncbi:hypothetical protein A9R16_003355 [Acidiferrobacter thiooxydans]|uniref:hypothetical protein n=1 Tax=Acidiferrobacter thiooxydans TaxID=163359 RepID=UPI0008269870|nr:hypothetical protein [Acidiferrobacter thiooxydans]UEO00451.1 hypothetical protein A9R16_003355 [Acidiferrobacter thiooxydans]